MKYKSIIQTIAGQHFFVYKIQSHAYNKPIIGNKHELVINYKELNLRRDGDTILWGGFGAAFSFSLPYTINLKEYKFIFDNKDACTAIQKDIDIKKQIIDKIIVENSCKVLEEVGYAPYPFAQKPEMKNKAPNTDVDDRFNY
jgi:hypothetical protein